MVRCPPRAGRLELHRGEATDWFSLQQISAGANGRSSQNLPRIRMHLRMRPGPPCGGVSAQPGAMSNTPSDIQRKSSKWPVFLTAAIALCVLGFLGNWVYGRRDWLFAPRAQVAANGESTDRLTG